jgi:hypothetical protein
MNVFIKLIQLLDHTFDSFLVILNRHSMLLLKVFI